MKELLLREDKRTLEKVISMARASEASKEQIKMMGAKEQNSENPSVNEIRSGDKQNQSSSRRPGSSSGSQKKKCKFCSSSHPWGSCPAFGKICSYCQKKDHFANVCRKKMRDFWGKIVHAVVESDGSDNDADFLTFSLESSGEYPTQDEWHASLKIKDYCH